MNIVSAKSSFRSAARLLTLLTQPLAGMVRISPMHRTPFTKLLTNGFRRVALILAIAVAIALGGIVPAAAQTYSVVVDFFNIPNGPQYLQYTGLIPQGRDGNLYGTSHEGGTAGIGTFFSVSPAGTETTLYSFDGSKGSYPDFGLTLGSDGNFYASTSYTSSANVGVLYKMTPSGMITVLHDFANTGQVASSAPPVQGKDGNYYGTTPQNPAAGAVLGEVYKLTPAGVYTTLHTLTGADGYNSGGLTLGNDGNFYGASQTGGVNNSGTFFKVSSKGVYKVLHNFDGTNGYYAFAPPVQGTDGNFYGLTFRGGPTDGGVIYKITSSGTYTVLHFLNGATDGSAPQAGLMQATDGNFYGAALSGGSLGLNDGTLFKITPAGVFTVVHNFGGGSLGGGPSSNLTQNTNGLLYGDTFYSTGGGTGQFYSLDIGAAPFVRLTLTSGKVASSVSLFGQGFNGSSVVKFGGVPATAVTLAGTTYITATVPVGAHSGPVTVTTGATTLTSNLPYKVTPAITTYSPTKGPVGTSVVIHGSGLIQATTVKFGTIVSSGFTVNSDSQITSLVPAGSAPGQVKIAITTPGGTATSAAKFTVQ